ncbi:MAG TPA: hypothetical protein VIN40_03090 [Candidatus Tyrphobacter sp.]
MPFHVDLVPLLQIERKLYDVPRGRERFDAYVATMTMGTGEATLPLTALNPMGREHVAAMLDHMIEFDLESAAREAAADAQRRLADADDSLRVALVVADDLKGGWTNRYFSEMVNRFERKYEVAHGWATVLFWTSEEPFDEFRMVERARAATFAAIYRTLHERKYGAAKTLRAIMAQEGRAARFAGESVHLEGSELQRSRAVIEPYLDSTLYPAIVAALYGDEAALSLGYSPLGLPERAGYAVALADALAEPQTPESALS